MKFYDEMKLLYLETDELRVGMHFFEKMAGASHNLKSTSVANIFP